MTVNVSTPQADFDSTRAALKTFVSQQGKFSDIDFEGSTISALVDILAYNTSINNFYRNMAVTETQRDNAKIRNNVIVRAQENGYVARSFTSAAALVSFQITSTNTTRANPVVPAGTVVSGRVDGRNFTFSTLKPVTTTIQDVSAGKIVFVSDPVAIAEGLNVSDSFVFTQDADLFEITNIQVDMSSVTVTVIEDQTNTIEFTKSDSIIGVGPLDTVFFTRVAPSGNYAVYFGDGITGRKPKLGSVVVVTYRVSNGQLANDISLFTAGQTIDGESNVVVNTITRATGGDIYEDTESIRFNGQNGNIVQQRSLYQSDIENDIKQQFPIINDISVAGGENVYPPQFGYVVITAVDTNLTNLTEIEQDSISQYITNRLPVTTKFRFAQANIIRLGVSSVVTTAGKSLDAVKTTVIAAVEQFAIDNVGKFGKSAFESKFSTAIDNSSPYIVGNNTTLTGISTINTRVAGTIAFGNAIKSITSAEFAYQATRGKLTDVQGVIYIVDSNGNIVSPSIGTVDYETGTITYGIIEATRNSAFDVIITPLDRDIIASGNMILKVNTSDITIS